MLLNLKQKLINFISIKNHSSIIYLHFKYYFIFIFTISFIILVKNSEIKLIIQGEGELNILNNSFYLDPSDIIVNGESKPECKKSCEFVNGLNNIAIKFDNQIESCEYMFDGIVSIIEVDLSNFDASHVVSMHRMFSNCITVIIRK